MFRENVAQEKEQVTFRVCFRKYYVSEELKIVVMEGPVPSSKIGTPHSPPPPRVLLSTLLLSIFTVAQWIL